MPKGKKRNQEENTMWKQGVIGIPNGEGSYTAVKYCAKIYDEPSKYGIEEGRISKLELRQGGKIVYNYDRGLDIPPQTAEAEMALAILLKEYE